MSLFKPLRGSRVTLDAQPLHDGYAYFCTDDGSFHIDYTDADGNLQRKQINAKDCESIMGMSLDELKAHIANQDTVILAEAQAYTDDTLAKAKASGEIVTRTELQQILNITNGVGIIDAGKIIEEGVDING